MAGEIVRDELSSHWDRDEAGLAQVREMKMRGVTEKAWRYVAEMEEIATTFEAVGQTDGFHKAAADVYRRLSPLKEGPHPSDYDTVIAAMKG